MVAAREYATRARRIIGQTDAVADVLPAPSARVVLRLALAGALFEGAAFLLAVIRNVMCLSPNAAVDATALALPLGAASLLGAAIAGEVLRQRASAIEERRLDQMMTLALLGLVAAALAALMATSRLAPC